MLTISHFNNEYFDYISPISGLTKISSLLEKTNLDENQKIYLNQIKESTVTLYEIIETMIDISYINNNTNNHDFFLSDQLFNKLIKLFIKKSQFFDIKFFYSITNDIPQYLLSDSIKLEQIIILIFNYLISIKSVDKIDMKVDFNEIDTDSINLFFIFNSFIDQNSFKSDNSEILFNSFFRDKKNKNFFYEYINSIIRKNNGFVSEKLINLNNFEIKIEFQLKYKNEIENKQEDNIINKSVTKPLNILAATNDIYTKNLLIEQLGTYNLLLIADDYIELLNHFDKINFDCIIIDEVIINSNMLNAINYINNNKKNNTKSIALLDSSFLVDYSNLYKNGFDACFTKPLKTTQFFNLFI